MRSIFLYSSFLILISSQCIAQSSGTFDSTFSDDGFTIYDHDDLPEFPEKMILQPDDKMIVINVETDNVGTPTIYDDDSVIAYVSRYDTAGDKDAAFGTDGRVKFSVRQFTYIYDVLLQPDNKILVCGNTKEYTTDETDSIYIARLNPDGSMDNTFGEEGFVFNGDYYVHGATGGLSTFYFAMRLELQADNKILLGTSFYKYSTFTIFPLILRFNTDGSPDTDFGVDGHAEPDFSGSSSYLSALHVADDGRIFCMGYVSYYGDMFVLKSNGNPDSSFSADGFHGNYFPDYISTAIDFMFLPDDRIMALYWGLNFVTGSQFYQLIKFKTTGQLDEEFGISGVKNTFLHTGSSINQPCGFVQQHDGKYLIGGHRYTNPSDFATRDLLLQRVNADGSADSEFGVAGNFSYDFSEGADLCRSVCLSSDSSIMLCGYTYTDSVQQGDIALLKVISGLEPVEVGIADLIPGSNTLLFGPNPVQYNASLSFILMQAQNMDLRLYSADGKFVHEFYSNAYKPAGRSEEQLQFPSELADGNYVLVLGNENHHTSVQISIQR